MLLLCIVWQFASYCIGSDLILPAPLTVIAAVGRLCCTQLFWQSTAVTLVRVLQSFVAAAVVALVLGTVSGCSRRAEVFLSPLMTVLTAVPMVSLVLLAMFWFGAARVPVFASVIMTVPIMVTAVAGGIHNVDRKLLEMCRVYAVQGGRQLRYFYVPAVLPSFAASAGTALGITWKVTVAGEVLALPRYGAGTCLQVAKVHLETADVFAWTVVMLVLSAVTGKMFSIAVTAIRRRTGVGG